MPSRRWPRTGPELEKLQRVKAAYIVEGNLDFYVIPREPEAMPVIGQVLTQVCRRGKSRVFSICPGSKSCTGKS